MNNAFVHVLGYRARDFPEKLEYGEGGEVKTANESGVAVRFKSEEQKIIWRRPCGCKVSNFGSKTSGGGERIVVDVYAIEERSGVRGGAKEGETEEMTRPRT